MNIKNILIKE